MCKVPGMANHFVMVCVAVVRSWSSGTSWSTSPIFRASVVLYSRPNWRATSVVRCPTVLIIVSLNLHTGPVNTTKEQKKNLALRHYYSLPERCNNAKLRLIETNTVTRIVCHYSKVTCHRYQTTACRTGTLRREENNIKITPNVKTSNIFFYFLPLNTLHWNH